MRVNFPYTVEESRLKLICHVLGQELSHLWISCCLSTLYHPKQHRGCRSVGLLTAHI